MQNDYALYSQWGSLDEQFVLVKNHQLSFAEASVCRGWFPDSRLVLAPARELVVSFFWLPKAFSFSRWASRICRANSAIHSGQIKWLSPLIRRCLTHEFRVEQKSHRNFFWIPKDLKVLFGIFEFLINGFRRDGFRRGFEQTEAVGTIHNMQIVGQKSFLPFWPRGFNSTKGNSWLWRERNSWFRGLWRGRGSFMV